MNDTATAASTRTATTATAWFTALLAVLAYLAGGGLVSAWVTYRYGLIVQSALWSVHGVLVALVVVLVVRWYHPKR